MKEITIADWRFSRVFTRKPLESGVFIYICIAEIAALKTDRSCGIAERVEVNQDESENGSAESLARVETMVYRLQENENMSHESQEAK